MNAPAAFLRALALAVSCAAVHAAQEPANEPAAAPPPAPQASPRPEPARGRPIVSITRQETKEGSRWSVLCEQAPLDELVRALAKRAGLALEQSELLPVGAEVSIELERRPLEQVLAIVLGTHGLRHELARGTLRILPPTSDPTELLRLAQDAWRTVEAKGEAEGDPHAATRSRLAQGNIAEVRGDLEGAYRVYSELAAESPSEDSAEATFRAGRILERLGHWAEAAQHFRTLASLEEARRFHSKARLELARASIELGDAKSALHLLNFLDANYATDDEIELAERRLVRARACNATHDYVEALRTLEEGEVVTAALAEARSLAIRAEAFEGLGFEAEAARAWLIFAREAATAEERASAFEKAAALSLAAGDELGTLFVCREAAKAGADEGLGSFAHSARLRLGLDEEEPPTTIQERLDLAESLLARDERQEAAELFEGLYLARGALSEPDQARVLAGWSRILLDRVGLEAALDVLSKARASFEDPTAARTLDLAAAALLESEGRFDDAAEAYRGDY
jgi:hypothetical protein